MGPTVLCSGLYLDMLVLLKHILIRSLACQTMGKTSKEVIAFLSCGKLTLGDFLCIPTPNPGQLNLLFHNFAEFRLIVNKIVARQSTDWLAANAQFSPNGKNSPFGKSWFLFPLQWWIQDSRRQPTI